MNMTFREIVERVRKINLARGGSDWRFDNHMDRLTVTQQNGGVAVQWFDAVANIYRRTYLKNVTLQNP